jgi:hypothetical protein
LFVGRRNVSSLLKHDAVSKRHRDNEESMKKQIYLETVAAMDAACKREGKLLDCALILFRADRIQLRSNP